MTAPTNTVKHTPDATDSIADDLLRNGYERWLRLEEEKAAIADDLKELFAELKAQGFTPKALRESFRRVRNADNADQQEHDAIVDLYVASLTRARPARTREASYSEAKGRGDAKLAATVATGMQTEIGRKALVTALDIMIEREEAGEPVQEMHEFDADAKGREAAAPKASISKACGVETVKSAAALHDLETDELTDNQQSEANPAASSAYVGTAPDENPTQDDVGATTSSTNSNGLAGPACAHDDEAANTKPAPYSNSPDDLLPVEADTTDDASLLPASSATLSDPSQPTPDVPLGSATREAGADAAVASRLSSDDGFHPSKLTFLRKSVADYRPHCLHPENCGAAGLKHCHACVRALGLESEAA